MWRHGLYLAVLAACIVGTLPLEFLLRTRVYARPRRLLLSVAPPFVLFVLWDAYAVGHHHWSYDPRQIIGVTLPGHLPIEEVLFFLVVPVCSILTLEAVRAARGWRVGDEPADESPAQ